MKRAYSSKLSLVAAAVVLGGCAITPTALDDIQLAENAELNLAQVTADQEPIHGRIGLYEAIARALKYNLDHRVELFQRRLRSKELRVAHFEMLPDLVANSEFARRDNFAASTSRQVVGGQLGAPGAFQNFNTSQERQRRTADIEFTWHVLDFGLSYVRAHQAADKVLIAEEARRKVVARIVEDVRTAFWRAVTAERLVARMSRLEARTRRALANTRKLSTEEETSPVTALTYERELVTIKRTIQELRRDLSVAKTQLAALMNVKPGRHFHLKYPRLDGRGLALPGRVNDMIWTAMNKRSELRDVAYRKRINMKEADAALLELLPGLQLYAGANYDSNDFLLNS
ncbi:MAG: TolC family protein, partial [Pseudomonadota bacterium]